MLIANRRRPPINTPSATPIDTTIKIPKIEKVYLLRDIVIALKLCKRQ